MDDEASAYHLPTGKWRRQLVKDHAMEVAPTEQDHELESGARGPEARRQHYSVMAGSRG